MSAPEEYKLWVASEEFSYNNKGEYVGKKVHIKVAGTDNNAPMMLTALAEKIKEVGGWVNKLKMSSNMDVCDSCPAPWYAIDGDPLNKVWIDARVIVPKQEEETK